MKTKIIEVTNGPRNWGKMLVGQFDAEWEYQSVVAPGSALLSGRGWGPGHILVLDLQTGEGSVFRHGGLASADLEKHAIWVCPMFAPFLDWLYRQDVSNLDALPPHVDLPEAEFHLSGYRRPGPSNEERRKVVEGLERKTDPNDQKDRLKGQT